MRHLMTTVLFIFLFGSGTVLAETIERTSESGTYIVRVQTDPKEPVVGNNSLTLTLLDGKTRAPVEAAEVEVVPWMTIHSHGSSKKTRVAEQGRGVYLVSDVYFTMAGEWDLIISVRKNRTEDSAVVTLKNVRH